MLFFAWLACAAPEPVTDALTLGEVEVVADHDGLRFERRRWTTVADSSLGADGQLSGTSGAGMTLAEFAQFLVAATGAEQALNLDGAVSTQMIVRTPSGRWALTGERGTINAVVLAR